MRIPQASRSLGRRLARAAAAAVAVGGVVLATAGPPAAAAPADPGTPVRVNQVGYLPEGPKVASVAHASTSPLSWELQDGSGSVVASGQTTVFGDDSASGDHVHRADFSDYTQPGSGYTLVVDGSESEPFEISADLYDQLREDALTFLYHQRSGIEIEAQHVGQEYARPAGHVGVSPNQGDLSVPCLPDIACDYSLDVSGGWYDAGDHGKYVVAGGFAAWTVLNQYERATHVDGADAGALGDGTLPLPEQGNGVPDILDEARWELEFLMSMQVPQGEDLAGMAHHKIHDEQWTGIPTPPHEDSQPRYLHAPSTTATLNLAASAAQCARVYDEFDQAFADQCLTAAERAWDAAQANPDVIADPNDGTGGGAYSDQQLSDEFYWAAAELFITTGDSTYLQALDSNEYSGEDVFFAGGFSWQQTAALGRLSLAVVPNDLSASRLDEVRKSVTAGADAYMADQNAEGYLVPYAPTDGSYVWGSNGNVLANGMVLATAHDLTGDQAYADAALQTMSYILGRNALNQSYVAGYGERATQNVHHRFWANQADSSFPQAPAGTMAGGPASGQQDPIAEEQLPNCAPQKCYIDHIESYSTNEVTIYWNAPLAWLAAFAAEQAGDGDPDDTQAPSAPTDLSVSDTSQSSVTLSWSASSDNVGVTGYDVYRDDGILDGSTSGTSLQVTGLAADTSHEFYVVARDAAGNESDPSQTVTATTDPQSGDDTTPPTTPGDLSATSTSTSVTLSWSAASDNVGVVDYRVIRVEGDALEILGTTEDTSFEVTELDPDTEYTFEVRARDAAGNASDPASITTSTQPETGGTCAVDYTVQNEWNSGFTGNITITNNGDALDSWTLEFDLPGGQQVTNGWSGDWSQSGEQVTVSSMSWNGNLGSGDSVSIGFNASHSGDNPDGTGFTLNGASCSVS